LHQRAYDEKQGGAQMRRDVPASPTVATKAMISKALVVYKMSISLKIWAQHAEKKVGEERD